MATIETVYARYHIMSMLQQHQLRVAAVAQYISQSLDQAVNTAHLVQACLLHDMGNIVKFDLTRYPSATEPEGLEYWQHQQAHYRQRYGSDPHQATIQIVQELNVPPPVLDYIEATGFTHAPQAVAAASLEPKICNYADQRVAPQGVMSLAERQAEGRQRYAGRPGYDIPAGTMTDFQAAAAALEAQIFAHSRLQPSDITEAVIQPIMEELRAFTL